MEIIEGNTMVRWVDLGEGMCGDYNDEDPDDEPLLRFDVCIMGDNGEWESPQDSSFCTLMPVDTDDAILTAALERILASVKAEGIGRNLDLLSWMEPHWFTVA